MSISLNEIFEQFRSAKIRSGQRSDHNFKEIKRYLNFLSDNNEKHISYNSVLDWHQIRRQTLGDYALQESYLMVRAFSVWANLIEPANEKLPKKRRRLSGRRIPVILSEHQVVEIIKELETFPKLQPLSRITYSTLIGMLYATGMRIGEALINLSDDDVNLEAGYIYVRASKAARDRYIPIGKTMSQRLAKYRNSREDLFPGCRERFFRTFHGYPDRPAGFRKIFNRVTANLGYRAANQRGYNACSLVPHDLRHSFATNKLMELHRQKKDIRSELPKLSIILGHHSVEETYWYIHCVPDLLANLLERKVQNA